MCSEATPHRRRRRRRPPTDSTVSDASADDHPSDVGTAPGEPLPGVKIADAVADDAQPQSPPPRRRRTKSKTPSHAAGSEVGALVTDEPGAAQLGPADEPDQKAEEHRYYHI